MAKYYIGDGEDEQIYNVKTLSEGMYEITEPDGKVIKVDAFQPIEGRLNVLVEGRSLDFDVREEKDTIVVQRRGIRKHVDVLNERQKRMQAAGVGGKGALGPNLESPMAGKVVAVQVAVGDDVEEGTVLVIVEAMKMENDLKAHLTGKVVKIAAIVGDAVEVGDVLVTLEAAE